jgi:hypothetical protein
MSDQNPGLPLCGQCSKPSVVQMNGIGLCVDCWHKVEVTKTLAMRLNAIGMNYALDQMDEISGLPHTGARMQVPDIPKGPIILHNIKVDNSVVGAINTGNVQAIDVNLTYLEQAGNDKARDALKTLTEAVLRDASLTETERHEFLDQVAFLTEQSVASAKDRKPGLINATLASLTQTATTVTSVAAAWQAASPILKSLFGL